jgi:serine/threonine-protein kinase
MHGDHEAQLRWVLAEGILSPAEVEALREEARASGRSPLRLMHERGWLSDEQLAALEDGKGVARPTAPVQRPEDPPRADDETASILAPVQSPPVARRTSRPGEPSFPVPGWERFQPVRFLGEGGMGRVFLAYDPKLRRQVALKFVRGESAELSRRALVEARAQARIDHERVCHVYEVGEIHGKVYIAMQFVDGRPLQSLQRELTVEQKAMVLRGVAEGVHEAHRAGLIHRDIKPSNILVERGEDGSLRPYVMDFGLARDWKEGMTATGTVLGTPQYMSPEQARGEVARLDRRTDVYSLGATLYHLLTGQLPIPGSNALEVLSNLATVEPRPLRELDRDLPVDLEAIVLKCLEKDRSARYDSARALAEDLDRFLAGEPVRARPAGWGYRLRKRLARHKRAVAGVAVAGVLVLLALGQALAARREVAERERLARRFTEQVELIESLSRYSGLAPRHDTRADRRELRKLMESLEGEIQQAGQAAVGPGNYALGRGHLALEDTAKARQHLEAAWHSGYQEPRVAYALALVMGRLYQEQLLEAERLRSPEQREARKRAIERGFRDPALEYLSRSQGAAVPATEYVSALLAFYEGRYEGALRMLDALGDRLPWFHEAPKLRGDIHLMRAIASANRGKHEEALADFEAGRKAYGQAAAIGESVESAYRSLANVEHQVMLTALYGQGDITASFARGLEAVRLALSVAPDSAPSQMLKARFYRRLAEHQMNQGALPEEPLAQAAEAARQAQALAPTLHLARLELGRVFLQWALARQGRGLDPREQLTEAATSFDAVPPEARDDQFHSDRGLIFKGWADYEDGIGADSAANRGREIEAYLTAIQLNPDHARAWINLGTAYFMRASRPRSETPDADLEEARKALSRAMALNPRHYVPYFYAAETELLTAQRRRGQLLDADEALAAAMSLYRKGLDIKPELPHLHNGVGSVLLEQASVTWDRGGPPEPELEQAMAAFQVARAQAPDHPFAHANLGEVHLWRAVYQRARGEAPGRSVRAAVDLLQQGVQRMPGNADFLVSQGWAHQVLAAFTLEHGGDPTRSLDQASEALEQALKLNPRHERAWLHVAETRGLRARWLGRGGRPAAGSFEDAAAAYQKAMELAPGRPAYRLAFGHFQRWWALWRKSAREDPGPALKQTLELADGLLRTRPHWHAARLLRASVLAELGRAAASPTEKAEWEARAAEDLRQAVQANSNLEHEWRNQLMLGEERSATR